MKKSNKILLSGLLTALVLLSAVHLSLYAKYKNGDYVLYQEDDLQPMSMQSFPHIKFVSLRHMRNIELTFGDTTRIRTRKKDWLSGFSFTQTGDTLHINGMDSTKYHQHRNVGLRLYVPQNIQLSLFHSNLNSEQDKNAEGKSISIYLNNSTASFLGNKHRSSLNELTVVAQNQSTIDFTDINITNLNLNLHQSILEEVESNINQLSIVADTASRISLQSKHLVKAKINTTSHE